MRRCLLGVVIVVGGVAVPVASPLHGVRWPQAQTDSSEDNVRAHASEPAPAEDHPVPRLKLSLEGFSVDTPLGTSVALDRRARRDVSALATVVARGCRSGGRQRERRRRLGAAPAVEYGTAGSLPRRAVPRTRDAVHRGSPGGRGHVGERRRSDLVRRRADRQCFRDDVAVRPRSRRRHRGVRARSRRTCRARSAGCARRGAAPTRAAIVAGTSTAIHFVDVTSDSLLWKVGIGIDRGARHGPLQVRGARGLLSRQ